MKGTKKVILGSALAIALSASMIAGSTFALFASESSVNIAVTSAKVNVSAKVENLQQFEAKADKEGELFDENGESYSHVAPETEFATFNAKTNELTVSGMKAGDKVTFDVAITNYSTIAVKYNLAIAGNGTNAKFMEVLKAEIDGQKFAGEEKFETSYRLLDEATDGVNGKAVKTVGVSLEIPIETKSKFVNGEGDGVQGETVNLNVTVNAVQGNLAIVAVPEGFTGVKDEESFRKALKAGENIYLTQDIECDTIELPIKNCVLDLGGHTVNTDFVRFTQAENVTIQNGKFACGVQADEAKNLKIVEVEMGTEDEGYTSDYSFFLCCVDGTQCEVVLENCTLHSMLGIQGGKVTVKDVVMKGYTMAIYMIPDDVSKAPSLLFIESGTFELYDADDAGVKGYWCQGQEFVGAITGGNFNFDISKLLSDGYEAVPDEETGLYTVVAK